MAESCTSDNATLGEIREDIKPIASNLNVHDYEQLNSNDIASNQSSNDEDNFKDYWFCTEHEEIASASGIKAHHGHCNTLPMADTLKTINKQLTLRNIESYTDDLIQTIKSTIQKKIDNKALLDKKAVKIKNEISVFYKKIMEELAKLEVNALRAVDSQIQVLIHREEIDEFELDIHQNQLMQLNEDLRKLQESLLDEMFLKKIVEINNVHKDIEHFLVKNENLRLRQDIEFLWSEFVHDFEERLPRPNLGHLISKPTVMCDINELMKPKKRGSIVELNVCPPLNHSMKLQGTELGEPRYNNSSSSSSSSLKLKTTFDTLCFDVSAQVNRGCFVSGTSILLKDMRHRTLYLLDTADGSFKQLQLVHDPLDIACFDDESAVVTLREGGIQILDLQNFCPGKILQSGVSFYAVSCRNNLIYARAPYRKLTILKISGEHVRTVESEYVIDYMCAGKGGIVYCTNYYKNKVFALTSYGESVFQQDIKSLRGPVGITVDQHEFLYVAGWLSNSIHVLDKEGNFVNIIGTERNGIYRPMGLSYNHRNNRIMVANASCISVSIYDINCQGISLDLI